MKYVEKYFEESKKMWNELVPKSGQADTIDGELLRAVERLRHEAHWNGNTNWDEGFRQFINYIRDHLIDKKVFDADTINQIKKDIKRLRTSYDPYLEDDLYDRLSDCVVIWSKSHEKPIPRTHDNYTYR